MASTQCFSVACDVFALLQKAKIFSMLESQEQADSFYTSLFFSQLVRILCLSIVLHPNFLQRYSLVALADSQLCGA